MDAHPVDTGETTLVDTETPKAVDDLGVNSTRRDTIQKASVECTSHTSI